MNRNIIITVAIIIGLQFALEAQKFGYINSAQLLIEMPEIKEADSQLEVYQKQLISRGEQMVREWEKKYNEANVMINRGELSQIQVQQMENELSTERQKIADYEMEVSQLIARKREELYSPILNEVKEVINTIGDENNYTMIFDTSTGGLLHVNEAENLMTQVKARLGI